jgi:hypothetical protein
MDQYANLTPAQKLERWTNFQPKTTEEAGWKRRAIRQFRRAVKAAGS